MKPSLINLMTIALEAELLRLGHRAVEHAAEAVVEAAVRGAGRVCAAGPHHADDLSATISLASSEEGNPDASDIVAAHHVRQRPAADRIAGRPLAAEPARQRPCATPIGVKKKRGESARLRDGRVPPSRRSRSGAPPAAQPQPRSEPGRSTSFSRFSNIFSQREERYSSACQQRSLLLRS